MNNFFASKSLADNITSFTATYGSTNENYYSFSDVAPLITHLSQLKSEGMKNDPEWTEHHPDWNKMLLIPIHLDQVTTTSVYGYQNTTTISIQHDLSISSTRLVGGSGTSQPIELKVAYGKYKNAK